MRARARGGDVDIWQKTQIGISKENSHHRSRVLNGHMWISPPCSVGPPPQFAQNPKSFPCELPNAYFHPFSSMFNCCSSNTITTIWTSETYFCPMFWLNFVVKWQCALCLSRFGSRLGHKISSSVFVQTISPDCNYNESTCISWLIATIQGNCFCSPKILNTDIAHHNLMSQSSSEEKSKGDVEWEVFMVALPKK